MEELSGADRQDFGSSYVQRMDQNGRCRPDHRHRLHHEEDRNPAGIGGEGLGEGHDEGHAALCVHLQPERINNNGRYVGGTAVLTGGCLERKYPPAADAAGGYFVLRMLLALLRLSFMNRSPEAVERGFAQRFREGRMRDDHAFPLLRRHAVGDGLGAESDELGGIGADHGNAERLC